MFLIGLRFNKLYRVDHWLPVFLAMPKMLTELRINKALAARGEAEALGFLEARTLLGGRGVTSVQYWGSAADVYRYASAPSTPTGPGVDRVQPAGPYGRRGGRHLARDVCRACRRARERLRRDADHRPRGRDDVPADRPEQRAARDPRAERPSAG